MRILIAHNFYRQAGGEDRVFRAEADLLESRGHDVLRYVVHNDSIQEQGRIGLSLGAVWNRPAFQAFQRALRSFRPDVVHIHNTLPLLSPAVYYAATALGIGVVQTLHNFRLICPKAILYRDDRPCEECIGRSFPLPAVIHRCYRRDRAASAVVASVIGVHRALGTWRREVDAYIALSEFGRQKFIQGGIPADRITVKPNFIAPDPGVGEHTGDYALFVGRLTPEKGVDFLARTWQSIPNAIPLKLAGSGPSMPDPSTTAHNIEWLGELTTEAVLELMKKARYLVFPSECYEGFPVTLVEAFATGLPVIATDIGGVSEIIEHGHNGLLFQPGDAAALRGLVVEAEADAARLKQLGLNARHEYETRYSADHNYVQLMAVYRTAIARRGRAEAPAVTGAVSLQD